MKPNCNREGIDGRRGNLDFVDLRGMRMLLRKINAGCSLLSTILLLDHAIFLSIWMLSRCSISKSAGFMPWVLMGVVVVHALISIDLAISGHEGAEKRKCKSYPKMNAATIVQRASGILMALLVGLHIAGAANHFQPKALHAVVHPLFFTVVLAHIAVSTSKSLITLGIGSANFIKAVDIGIKVLCVITLIAGVTGCYLCLFMGVAK